MHAARRLAASMVLVLLPAGCTTTSGSTPEPADAYTVDWQLTGPGHVKMLPDGWEIGRCPLPVVCLERNDGVTLDLTVSDAELSETPDDPATYLENVLGRAEGFPLRNAPCDLTVARDRPIRLAATDGVVIRAGQSGRMPAGPMGMVVTYAGVRAGHLVMLTARAADSGACVVGDGSATPADLTALVPVLDKVIVASGLPRLVSRSASPTRHS